ncbi:MAG: hypothetical protein D6724_10740 [Armatimonadetes bacterium]|nr:MAG: hypothetical protein D6724_10740 [Armatimonadota bacterium]
MPIQVRIDSIRAMMRGRLGALLKDAGLTTGSQLAGSFLNLARSAVLGRYLGVDDFGRLAIVLSTTVFVRQLLSVRTWEWVMINFSRAYVAKDAPQAGAYVRAGYILGLAINGCAAVVLVAVANLVAESILHEPCVASLLRINGLLLIAGAADETSSAVLRVLGRFRWLAAYGIVAAFLRFGVAWLVASFDLGLGGVVVSGVFAQALGGLWLYIHTRRALRKEFVGPVGSDVRIAFRDWRTQLRLMVTLGATDTVKTLAADLDFIVLGALHGPSSVGLYRASLTLTQGLHQLAVPTYMVFYPEMTKAAAARDATQIRALIKQMTWLGLVCGCIAVVALSASAAWIVRLLYGQGFVEATTLVRIMCWSLLVLAVQWYNPLFVSLGKAFWTFTVLVLALIGKATVILIFVPPFGAVGSALAHVSFFFATIVFVLLLRRRIALPDGAPAENVNCDECVE